MRSARTWRTVKQSMSAWVGCSCQPSPALMTRARVAQRATWCGAPEEEWRMIRASMPRASMVSTVSRSDSPFLTEELATASERTSADSRLAAVSKERRVRVDSSKKRVATTLPRRVGTLGTERRSTSAKDSATRRTSAMPSSPRSATDRRCWGRVTGSPTSRSRRPRRPRRPSPRGGWAGSCPRSRAGWGAPDGPGRP